ncbi:MAG: hypothetical protein ABGY71_06240 [bacterium]|nr:hypothetical protein [Planctomycetota bacterium]HIL51271.1 hypothetical protein [Planctomycetota bacterium]
MSAAHEKPLPMGEFIGIIDRRVALAVFFLILAVYTATFNGPAASPDAEVSFQTTSALWRTGSLAIGGTPEAEALIDYARGAAPGSSSVRAGVGASDEASYYGWYGVAQAVCALPFYALGRLVGHFTPGIEEAYGATLRLGAGRSEYFAHLFVGWRTPLMGAMTALLVALACIRLGLTRRQSFIGGLAYGLTTFAWPQALADLSDVQATFFVALASYALLVMRQRYSRSAALVLGFSAGLGLLTRVGVAPLIVCIDVAFVLVCLQAKGRGALQGAPQQDQRLALLLRGLLPQALALAIFFALNYLRFGTLLDSGYGEALRGGLFGGDPLTAGLGLLISPGKGLLWMAPALLLVFSGARRAGRHGRSGLALFALCIFLGAFLPALMIRGWHGAWCYGPRYLLPALPILWVLAVGGFARSDIDDTPRPVAIALLLLSLLIQVPGVLVDSFCYHEMAVQAARERFEVSSSLAPADAEAERFDALHFDFGFAAPWAHWRILRQRVADLGEEFEAREIFRYETSLRLVPSERREHGFGHLAWVHLNRDLGGRIWPAVGLILALAGAGLVLTSRALDRS